MSKRPQKKNDANDIVIDADSGDEVVAEETELAASALKQKLKTLRRELREVQKERDENLAGWQRSKADLVNFRRTVDNDRARDDARAQGRLARGIIPALDSFDQARSTETWGAVDKEWRNGVEKIHDQLVQGLATAGLTSFGEVGDAFDPKVHECMSIVHASDESKDHSVATVLLRGYRIDGEVVRPAKVVVAKKDDE